MGEREKMMNEATLMSYPPDTACRQSAKGVIEAEIKRLEYRIKSLRVLLSLLPGKPPEEIDYPLKEVDQAIWSLLNDRGTV